MLTISKTKSRHIIKNNNEESFLASQITFYILFLIHYLKPCARDLILTMCIYQMSKLETPCHRQAGARVISRTMIQILGSYYVTWPPPALKDKSITCLHSVRRNYNSVSEVSTVKKRDGLFRFLRQAYEKVHTRQFCICHPNVGDTQLGQG